MKITRMEQNKKITWQATMDDEEISNLVTCLVAGIVGNALMPGCRTLADGIVASLLADTKKDSDEIKLMMEHVRKSHAPGRFVIDVTELARPHVKDEELPDESKPGA